MNSFSKWWGKLWSGCSPQESPKIVVPVPDGNGDGAVPVPVPIPEPVPVTGSAKDFDFDGLEDFDVLLFSGRDYWFSYAVEWITWSSFSHVGIVLRAPTELQTGLTGIYMLEAGAENYPDAIEHRLKWGVQVTNLRKLFSSYQGAIYQRRITLSAEEKATMRQQVAKLYWGIADAPYDYNPADLLRAEIGVPVGDCRHINKFFCSALLTYVLSYTGLLAPNISWDLVTPKEYGNNWVRQELLAVNAGHNITDPNRLQ